MMYVSLLALHILCAVATGVVATYTTVVLWRKINSRYPLCTIILGVLASIEVTSGIILAVVATHVSIASVCKNLALYLSVCFVLEAILYVRMRKVVSWTY